jgi:hypothetical protein
MTERVPEVACADCASAPPVAAVAGPGERCPALWRPSKEYWCAMPSPCDGERALSQARRRQHGGTHVGRPMQGGAAKAWWSG